MTIVKILNLKYIIILILLRISPIKLAVGGPPMLPKQRKNQNWTNTGLKRSKPLFKKILRDPDIEYIYPTPKNIPEETNPWLRRIKIAP
jgi:hypothetical protein